MIKKLKRRFIAIAMLSFAAVLIVTLVAVNTVNRHNVYRSIDHQLVYLAASNFGPPRGMLAAMPETIQEWVDMEAGDITSEDSYFIFSGGMTESVFYNELNTLSTAAGMDAGVKLQEVLQGGKEFGTFGQYRYYVAQRETPYKVVFLRCSQEFEAMRSLLNTSVVVGFFCALAVFGLVTLLSGMVVRPFSENMERQKRFISDVSHELKTPLGVIMADLDMQVMDHGQTEWLENAQTQTDHMTELIDRLVTLSLLDESMQKAEAVLINFSFLTGDAAEEFSAPARARNLIMETDITPGVELYGNESSLRELLHILLDNAVKYTPEGGRIRVCLTRGWKTVLTVSNSCSGLSGEELERVFDRFYRASGSRAAQAGHGLGLSIARDIVSRAGGSIRAHLEEENVVFTVEL